MSTSIAHEQTWAARVLLALVTAHADLPAAGLELCQFAAVATPGLVWGVRLSVHDNLSHFEQWRDVLDLDPDTVQQGHSENTGWLVAKGTHTGVRVELVGFYDLEEGR